MVRGPTRTAGIGLAALVFAGSGGCERLTIAAVDGDESSGSDTETRADGEADLGETDESTDEGATDTGDGAPICGNGVVEPGEGCDDGDHVESDDCPSSCQPAVCGDGFRHDGFEHCDDGNTVDDHSCPGDCTWDLDPLCDQAHPQLDIETRNFWFEDGPAGVQLCDRLDAGNRSPDWVGPGWYQVGFDLAEFLLKDTVPDDYACGGTAGGWHAGEWINPDDGIVEVEICFALGEDPCAWSVPARQLHCGLYRLWELPEVPDCDLRYCVALFVGG